MTHSHQYELMVILDPEIDERQVAPNLDKFLKVITNDGGSIDKVDIWGKRRLAYDIKKKSEGIYVVVDFTSTPATTRQRSPLPSVTVKLGPSGWVISIGFWLVRSGPVSAGSV